MADYSFLDDEEEKGSSSSVFTPKPVSSSSSVLDEVKALPIDTVSSEEFEKLIKEKKKKKQDSKTPEEKAEERAAQWDGMKYSDQVDALMALTGGDTTRGQIEVGMAISPYALKNVFVTRSNDFSFKDLVKDAASLPFRSLGAAADQVTGTNDQSLATNLSQSMAETTGTGPVGDGAERNVISQVLHTIGRDPVNAAFPGVVSGAKWVAQTGKGAKAIKDIRKAKAVAKTIDNANKWKKGASRAAALGGAEELTRESANAALGNDFDILNVILGIGAGGTLGAGGGKLMDVAQKKFTKYVDDGLLPWHKALQEPPTDNVIKDEAPSEVFNYLTGKPKKDEVFSLREGGNGILDYKYDNALSKLTDDIKSVTEEGEGAAKLMDDLGEAVDKVDDYSLTSSLDLIDKSAPQGEVRDLYHKAVTDISNNSARKFTKEDATSRVNEIADKIRGDIVKGKISEEKGENLISSIYNKYAEYVLDPAKRYEADMNATAWQRGVSDKPDLSKLVDDPSSKMEVLFNQRNRLFNDMATNTKQGESSLEASNYMGGILNDVMNNQVSRIKGAVESVAPAEAMKHISRVEDQRYLDAGIKAKKYYEDIIKNNTPMLTSNPTNKFVRKNPEKREAERAINDLVVMLNQQMPGGVLPEKVRYPVNSKNMLHFLLEEAGVPVKKLTPDEFAYANVLEDMKKSLDLKGVKGLEMFQDMAERNLGSKAGAAYVSDVDILQDLGSKYEQANILNRLMNNPEPGFWDEGITSIVNPRSLRKFTNPDSGIRQKQIADVLIGNLFGTIGKGGAYRYDKDED